MPDMFTKKKRSEIMGRIRSKNTGIENIFCKLLSNKLYPLGYRYRRNYKYVAGCPDVVFIRYKVAIFLDGDFWHGYNYSKEKNRLPKRYWREKIKNNIDRDKRNRANLKKDGWKVVRIWEHEIKKNPSKALDRVISILK